MGVPKRRSSKQRGRQRKANWKIQSPNLISCPHCHKLTLSHRVCPFCGYYKAREVIKL
ncbi:MAG TPA: 50S ribosomal protein L32 [Desulfotomaculum sp.]|nr:50S ribosomal protein L32 [Desulfotomaculum sp.]